VLSAVSSDSICCVCAAWFPNTLATAGAVIQYNLAVAFAIRGELDKAGETLKQVRSSDLFSTLLLEISVHDTCCLFLLSSVQAAHFFRSIYCLICCTKSQVQVIVPPGYISQAGSFMICSKVIMRSRNTQYSELVTKIDVIMLMASIIEICHASEIMVWVEVSQIWMWLG